MIILHLTVYSPFARQYIYYGVEAERYRWLLAQT